MEIINKIKQMTGLNKGKITLLKKLDPGIESMTYPICEDIDNDSKTETITTNIKGELLVFSENQELKWKYSAQEKISEQEQMFLDEERTNSINHAPLITDLLNNGKKQIIFGTERGIIYCLNSAGKKLWEKQFNVAIRGGINTFQVIGDTKKGLIFGAMDKNIYLLAPNGELLKKIQTDTEIESTPIVYQNNIIIGDNKGQIKSITLKGQTNWTFNTKNKITTRAIITKLNNNQKAILITSTDNSIYCLSLKGELIWQFETKGALYSEPVVTDINDDGLEEIIIGSSDGTIYVLTMQGNQLWDYETDFWIMSKAVTKDINQDGAIEVIIGSYDNNVYVLTGKGLYLIEYVPGVSGIIAQNGSYSDIPTNTPGGLVGDKLWEYSTEGLIIGCASHNDIIVVQTKEGKILWLKYEEGK